MSLVSRGSTLLSDIQCLTKIVKNIYFTVVNFEKLFQIFVEEFLLLVLDGTVQVVHDAVRKFEEVLLFLDYHVQEAVLADYFYVEQMMDIYVFPKILLKINFTCRRL